MNCQILNSSGERIPKLFIENWTRAMAKAYKRRARRKAPEILDLDLVFLAPRAARALNLQYRKKDYATDVLSFSASGPQQEILGELVFCPSVLKKQAREVGHSFRAELGFMIVHGFLHLLGYDHERGPRAAKEMFELQDQIFLELCERLRVRGRNAKVAGWPLQPNSLTSKARSKK